MTNITNRLIDHCPADPVISGRQRKPQKATLPSCKLNSIYSFIMKQSVAWRGGEGAHRAEGNQERGW